MWKNEQKKEEPRKTNARVFALTQADADADPSVVSGEILIADIPTHALIDSGASHSFASITYVRRLGRLPDQLPGVFSTALPSGEILYSDQ